MNPEQPQGAANPEAVKRTRKKIERIATPPPDRGLTRKQAAAMTGYAEKTLANLALLGQGPKMRKFRHRCIYLESEVLAWLKSLPVSGETAS